MNHLVSSLDQDGIDLALAMREQLISPNRPFVSTPAWDSMKHSRLEKGEMKLVKD